MENLSVWNKNDVISHLLEWVLKAIAPWHTDCALHTASYIQLLTYSLTLSLYLFGDPQIESQSSCYCYSCCHRIFWQLSFSAANTLLADTEMASWKNNDVKRPRTTQLPHLIIHLALCSLKVPFPSDMLLLVRLRPTQENWGYSWTAVCWCTEKSCIIKDTEWPIQRNCTATSELSTSHFGGWNKLPLRKYRGRQVGTGTHTLHWS